MTTLGYDADLGYEPVFQLEDEALKCPYEHFRTARSNCPVSFSGALGFWVVSDHKHVLEVLKDTVTFSTKEMLGPQVAREWQMLIDKAAESPEAKQVIGADYGSSPRKTLLFADPPAHTKHRKLITTALSPAAIKSWEERITETAEYYVDTLAGKSAVEFVADFATPYTMAVIADILGLDRALVPRLLGWAEGFNSMVGNPNLTESELNALVNVRLSFDMFFAELITERRANPGADLISRVVAINDELDEPLTTDELLMVLQLTLVGGSDTSSTALAKMIEYLAAHPAQWEAMRADPKTIQPFMDELLRTESPVQGMFRAVTRDVELDGRQMKAGDVVWVSLGSANRDPEVFPNPDDKDVTRKGTAGRFVAFGGGPHVCPGSPLTRMELRIVLEKLTSRFAGVELDGAAPPSKKSFLFFGPAQLPVTFHS